MIARGEFHFTNDLCKNYLVVLGQHGVSQCPLRYIRKSLINVKSTISKMLANEDPTLLFTAPASLAGREFEFSLRKALAKGSAVVYIYPSAYTGGCDIKAHTFAVQSL
jgi:hypothetical protein